MRIACVHLPQFPLQAALRDAPALRGRAIAVVGGASAPGFGRALAAPVVIACSRAARAAGIRLGMTAPTARALAASASGVTDAVEVIAAEPETMIAASHAIAAALLELSPRVDRGGDPRGSHHAAYLEVPLGVRGSTFGARVIAALDALGVVARVGIADDMFTAWVAASQAPDHEEVVTVPRGGSAAFLAPQPLSLLAIPPEVQHVLGALGVHTLGEFAALPPPSVARAWDADYQQLARGEGGATIHDYAPPAAREVVVGVLGARAAEPSLPTAADGFQLTAPIVPITQTSHLRGPRRPARGKHRPRVHTPAAQARLFGDAY
jgi:protein ImuB